ncbi:MAG: ATP-binding cassette domain-containing protein [Flexistipes sinusarabici]|uniref:ATP-binding cassette domain-containing protein n=2 Tax=Flexistipes sinusarabici TaxID=2352 RepID=A0A5D0MMH1_FLESI|nr:MAG: ATP-binding cassette domain-containing protein [Flexistipes sinusarabici]
MQNMCVSGVFFRERCMFEIDVTKRLKGIAFNFKFSADSNRIVLFGPSGAGKSSIIKMIAGFFSPDKGHIKLNSKIFFDSGSKINIPVNTRKVGYLPQEYTLFPHLNVKENIQYGLNFSDKSNPGYSIGEIAEKLGISEKLDSSVQKLSGGQRQRVALARILVLKPSILLLDEPFSALDSSTAESLRELVADISDELNIPSIFITHNLSDAYMFAKDLVLVEDGKIVEFGKKEELYSKPAHTESARLMGFKNIWNAYHISGNRVLCDKGYEFTLDKENKREDATHICIRPENVMIIRPDHDIKSSLKENIVTGRINRMKNAGKDYFISIISDNGLAIHTVAPVHACERMDLGINKKASVSLKQESIVLTKDK